ncbi:restriction endonuclease [Pseudoxanthomonas sp. J35]|uniref:restriction endonuclease n=1 Tax=Pseudoxanthomonas sp. J35 TaxID=935852 RepID=UPI00048BFBA3|nr:restriction endonuclease [Pseudoxanthomonas sp. J35]
MSSWTVGLALAALVATASIAHLWLVRRPEKELDAGLRALANLRWREIATLIGQAMQQRGLRDVAMHADSSSDPASSQLLMTDGDSRWLLSCKHGMAYRLGVAAVDELAAGMELTGARAGILLTEGRAGREALAAAAERGIEIIDGRRLWPLLKPFLPQETTAGIAARTVAEAKRQTAVAVAGSIALGLAVAVLLPRLAQEDAAPATATQAAAPPAAAPTPAQPALAEQAATDPVTGKAIEDNPDAPTEARYQAEIARTLNNVPGITRAYWLTRATLVVERTATDKIVWPFICGELERYPSLRTVRVQLNPRPGTDEPVRWRQCRTM